MAALENRYDFVFLFDCQDGNPNGDPDADNRPRVDPQTGNGLVSDVCLKRKIRDFVLCAKSAQGSVEHGYDIFVLGGNSLEQRQKLAYNHLQDKAEWKAEKDAKKKVAQAADWMCENFFDVRTFGAVMSTKEYNCGQVRGPLQITFSRSLDKILPLEHTITRVAYTKEEKRESTTGETEFGGKFTIPYGLYVAYGYVNPFFSKKTGFSLADLELTRKALGNLFELDRSAARGNMTARGLAIFKHDCKLGNAPAQSLFDSVIREKRAGVDAPRSIADYQITLPKQADLPKGITLIDGLSKEIY
jgi:CRISPR-associated protein Csd2